MSIGDTINFHFLSYAEGWTDWGNCWMYDQSYDTLVRIPDDTITLQPGEQIPFYICYAFALKIREGTYTLTTTVDATET